MWVIYHKGTCGIIGRYSDAAKAGADYVLLLRSASYDQFNGTYRWLDVEEIVNMEEDEWRMWKLLGGEAA